MVAHAGAAPAGLALATTATHHQGSSAFERLSRYIARFASAGAAAYLILLTPQILGQSEQLQPWYTPVFVALIFGPALFLWYASFRLGIRAVHAVVTVMALTYLLAQLLWIPSFDGPKIDGSDSTWIALFPGLISLATAVAWPVRYIAPYLLVVASYGQVINYASREEHGNLPLFPDIVFGIMFCGIFTLTVTLVLRTGRVLDATLVVAESQAATAAASAARSVERERFDALIHDDVMSTLLSASRAGNSAALAGQSAAALGRLDRLRSGMSSTQPLSPVGFVNYVRDALTRVDESIGIDTDTRVEDEAFEIPMEVVRALAASAAEALRNSMRHSGDPLLVRRGVWIVIEETSVTVDVHDDGSGFDPRGVAPHRLGLAVSIHGRMRQLVGGSAVVTSTLGHGTIVRLSWTPTDPVDGFPV